MEIFGFGSTPVPLKINNNKVYSDVIKEFPKENPDKATLYCSI